MWSTRRPNTVSNGRIRSKVARSQPAKIEMLPVAALSSGEEFSLGHTLTLLFALSIVGLVSIGDIVKAQHDRLALENQFMKDYIHKG